MLSVLKQLYEFINFSKARIVSIIVLNIIEALFAISGIALLFPLIKFLEIGREAFIVQMDEGALRYLKSFVDYMNIEISLGLLILFAFSPMLLQQIMRYFKEVSTIHLQHNATCQIRQKLIKNLFLADIDFYTKTKLGVIANTLTTNALWSGLIVQYLVGFWSFLLIGIIYLIMLFTISFKLTVISLGIVSLVPLLTRKQTSTIRVLSKTIEGTNAGLHEYLVDKLRFIKRIFLLNTTKKEELCFSETANSLEKAIVKGLKIKAFVNAMLEPVFFLAILAIIFIGVNYLKTDFSVLILFMYVLSRLNPQIKGMVNSRNQVLIYHRSFKKVLDTYNSIKKASTIISGSVPFKGLRDGIFFDNVDFSYEPDKSLFQGLSLSFKRNRTTALVGKSGSGKSTIVDLILRFRDINGGSLKIDDTDIRDMDIASYRRKVGVVTQDSMLFHGTILENITYGLGEISTEDINRAGEMAHINEFVGQLKDGYDTSIGEVGSKLSGGQKQRLALTHMFLQDPDIILLDEPTSALDSESEKIIKNTLDAFKGRKTIIIIAHRLSTIKEADQIIVLDNGSIKEEGTYEELIQKGSYFKRMVELQEI